MNAKLSPRMLAALRAIDAGEPKPKALKVTVRWLWLRGLIVDIEETGRGDSGWKLTPEGKLALHHGRQMLTRRTP